MQYDDPTILQTYDLDILQEEDFEPTKGEIANLLGQIDRGNCQGAQIVQLTNGDWFLRWEERHPEMVSGLEFFAAAPDTAGITKSMLREFHRLRKVLPAKDYELSVTRRQAFAILAVCWLPEEFEAEIAELFR